MHSRTIAKMIEGTGLDFNINAGGAVVFTYKGEVVTHKRAIEIIDAYREKHGLPPIGWTSPVAPASSAVAPSKQPKKNPSTTPAVAGLAKSKKTVFTGMHSRTIAKMIEGTGLDFNINAGGAIVFTYKGEVVTHKRASEIIEDYRNNGGASLAIPSYSSIVPPKRPKGPRTVSGAADLPKK